MTSCACAPAKYAAMLDRGRTVVQCAHLFGGTRAMMLRRAVPARHFSDSRGSVRVPRTSPSRGEGHEDEHARDGNGHRSHVESTTLANAGAPCGAPADLPRYCLVVSGAGAAVATFAAALAARSAAVFAASSGVGFRCLPSARRMSATCGLRWAYASASTDAAPARTLSAPPCRPGCARRCRRSVVPAPGPEPRPPRPARAALR